MRTLKCDNCASSDFEKISDHEYRCRYCGSVKIMEPGVASPENQTPPMLMPQKKHILALVLIFIIMIVGLFLVTSRDLHTPPKSSPSNISFPKVKSSPLSQFGSDSVSIPPPPKASFDQAAAIPDSIGNCYFAGIYKNTGKSPLRKPMVVITLYSSNGRKVAQNHGYSIREILQPGEETPVSVLITHPPQWERFEATHLPQHPYPSTSYDRPVMKFRNCMLQKAKYTGYEIRGEIVNLSDRPARRISMIAAVFDREKKIIGTARGYVSAISIAPNDYSPINIRITTVKGEPHSFVLDYEGYY